MSVAEDRKQVLERVKALNATMRAIERDEARPGFDALLADLERETDPGARRNLEVAALYEALIASQAALADVQSRLRIRADLANVAPALHRVHRAFADNADAPSLGRMLVDGCLDFVAGDFHAAYAQFDAARRMHHEYRLPFAHGLMGLASCRPLAELVAPPEPGERSDFAFDGDRRFDTDLPVLFVALDARYFARHAARIVETSEGMLNIHFHVANPDMSALISSPRVRYSFETYDAVGRLSYFASMRFLHLPRILRRYDRPLLVTDADMYFEGSPAPLFERMKGYQLGLNFNSHYQSALPWRYFSGAIVVATPCGAVERFLDLYRRQFYHIHDPDRQNHWWIDQAILTSTWVCAVMNRDAPQIGDNFHTRLANIRYCKG